MVPIYIILCFILIFSSVYGNDQCENGVCNNPDDSSSDIDLSLLEFPEAELPKGANELGTPKATIVECIDRHEECGEFQSRGECEANPGWMIINCPKSCDTCELRDPKLRCDRKQLGISEDPIYQPGDMEKMFQSIEPRFASRYNLTVLSKDPWVVVFDGFLTNDESKALVSHVDKWERSTDTGETNEFGETGRIVSTGRTSSNAWCREDCESDPLVQNVMSKIEEVTYVPTGKLHCNM